MFFRSSPFRFISIFLLALTILSFVGKTFAQLDPTFGTNGVVSTALGGAGTTLADFVLPDGKILVVAVAKISNQQKTFFFRYNSDGTPDSSYGTNGKVQLSIPFITPNSAQISRAVRQSDGKIVIAGYDYSLGVQKPLMARFNEDGTVDTTFAGGSGISRPNISQSDDVRFSSLIIQPDGKILLTGGLELSSNTQYLFLMRYQLNGSVDTSFGSGGGGFIIHNSLGIEPYDEGGGEYLFLQSNGKIIVGVVSTIGSGSSEIRRFNTDGTADNSFTAVNLDSRTLFVQPDDKILVGSQFSKTEAVAQTHTDSRISRYNADGAVDTGFGTNGQVSFDVASYSDDSPRGLQVMPDGQILVALNVEIQPNRSIYRGRYWVALARLSPNGAVNGKFLVASMGDNLTSYIKVLPDGKILTALRGSLSSTFGGVGLVRVTGVPLQNYLFHSIPFYFGNYPGTNPSFYRPSTNSFFFGAVNNVINTGFAPGDILAPADFIGGLGYNLAYFRPSNGTWYIVEGLAPIQNIRTVRWGADGDIPAPADYNGDGKADPAVFRPSDGNWYIYHIADGSYSIVHWGTNGDKPVPGDYDGDGIYDRAVFRPSTGEWWILRSSDYGYTRVTFGLEGDIPVQEDYDGDGKFDIAVYRPSNGIWYRINSSDISFFAYQWGIPGDIPVPGNYDTDQKANVAVWRPSNGTWYIVNPDYNSMFTIAWGMNGDRPLPGKY
ncbi:MAG TPA: hypothetical protein VNB22_07770 [Pyrinomonadaceae bacterium]|jgi:uncharacterized delta-60 repeat protein|nr:hypothetical protein [Pyrinomonadaceae bacterium]